MGSEVNVVVGACGEHLVVLDSWGDGDLFMQTWTPTASHQYGRLYWAWNSLRGRWQGDNEVVFDRDGATALRDALTAHLNRTA